MKDQAANILTKPLSKSRFLQLKSKLTVCSMLSLREGVETVRQLNDASGKNKNRSTVS